MILKSQEIAEMGIAIALAFVLSTIKVYHLPSGGSVTAGSMVPILIFALRRGTRLGLATAVLYGLVQIIEGAYIVHPVQALLDYPIAFGMLGLAGFFLATPLLGVIVGIGGRFIAHFFSGVIFFSEYAPPGQNVWVYSAGYNASYLVPELIVSAILIYLLVKKGVLELYK
jgi:thiamine transporter